MEQDQYDDEYENDAEADESMLAGILIALAVVALAVYPLFLFGSFLYFMKERVRTCTQFTPNPKASA